MALHEWRLRDVQKQLEQKEVSVSELVDHSLARINQTDERIKAFITVDEEGARSQAAKLDAVAGRATDKPLFGLPIGLKDNIVTEGLITTCASQFLRNYNPIYDSTVASKLKDAGTITMGKLNMDEFGMGGSSENSSFHVTRNPWNEAYVAGGSSSGSAAAVAAGQVYFALGTDTGGSIRQPAAYCGVVGLKPTYGLVSRFGVVAFASSFDQVGPITKNVEDAAFALQAIAGYDKSDTTSANVTIPDYSKALDGNVAGLKIAVPREYLGEGVDPQVKEAIQQALKQYESMGAVVEEVSMPHTEYAVATYYLLSSSEASSNLARFDGVRYGVRAENPDNLLDLYLKSRSEGFGPEVKRRIMLGTYALSSGYYDAYYLKAQKVRTLIKQDFDQIFEKYDVVIGPTVPKPAFKVGDYQGDPLTMYMNDICTIPASLSGVPAISIPCGMVDGLPIGMQIIGKAFDESTVLKVAHAFEAQTNYHQLRPEL
ncbi:Asp-tRNA(Asn)/Glu-tRNA(Gln) amidotransferase subunit GatA [Paenibacillus yanchengensis]|uniref:Glutamyl-tRNA(Gln) amidotransferase subunit A n=1 Tax=Paenibacillus yanchengensis TaxID=2035833 RepID=A0ABW4YJ69_9BACL